LSQTREGQEHVKETFIETGVDSRILAPDFPVQTKEASADEAVYSESFFLAWLASIVAVISWLPIQLRINDIEVFNPITRSSWRLISLGHPSPCGLSFAPAGGL
jgi:hypothetical protein